MRYAPKPHYQPRDLARCYSIDDLRKLAKTKLPAMVFDFVERGAEDETTLMRNLNDYQKYVFKPKVLVDAQNIDLSTHLLDIPSPLPIILAPTGLTKMFHPEGELGLAKAAYAKGLIYSLSTVSTYAIEDIAKVNPNRNFLQIYVWRDTTIVDDLVKRAKAANFQGLYLAVDTTALGNRERDLQNGQKEPLRRTLNMVLGSLHPRKMRWLIRFLKAGKPVFANLINHVPEGAQVEKTITHINEQFNPSVSWSDAQKLQQEWGGHFMIKGIQSVEDAIKAAKIGAHAIVISNHGGRQLDGAPTALDILPSVVKAFQEQSLTTEIYIDGGIRRGSDIIKAIALGAKAVLIGRAQLYGLACGGQAGAEKAINILEAEMIRVMQLIGCTSLQDLTPDYVHRIDK